LQQDPALAGVYTLNHFIDDRGNILPQPGGENIPRQAFRARNLQGGFFAVHAAVVRADVVREVGLFDTRLTSEEDWDLWLRIADRYEMQCIAQPLVGYRVYPGSMSTNALRMHANRIAVLTKHFGPSDGEPSTWNDDKRRAYGFAFRSTAFALFQQNQADEGWRYLTRAVQIWPALLRQVDTFYELICGDQPSGYRGQANQLNIESNGVRMLKWLDEWCAAQSIDRSLRQTAYSNAYLAMGMLSDQAGHWTAARSALRRAVRANPRLMLSGSFTRRLIKLYAGTRFIGALRKVSNT
jgi:tetratricopeptide (TPR) repeat protein